MRYEIYCTFLLVNYFGLMTKVLLDGNGRKNQEAAMRPIDKS